MMDPMASSYFELAATEAHEALVERFGPDAVVGQSLFVVEVQEGAKTTVWVYSTDARAYVQLALLNEGANAVREHAQDTA